jgi:hypothetical protein
MSSTRKAKSGSPLRQERYASSSALRKGLLANLVAKRCEALSSAADRELVFFLAELSLRNGFAVHRSCNLFPQWLWDSTGKPNETAFERVARELTELWPERVTKSVKRARSEIAACLPRLCLDARVEVESAAVKSFAGLIQALREYQRRFESAVLPKVAMTEVTETIFEALDYCLVQRGMVLVEGTYRSGKSFSSQAWCQMHLGQSRYVQLSSSTDVSAFYRDIARAVGVACSLQMKAMEMRARIEDTLRGQQLLLCVDESEWLFPQSSDVRAVPERMSWLMTALVNQGVPVALIGSRNFTRLLHNAETRCPVWGSEQLHGRIKLRKSLPESLSEADLFKIARAVMPEANEPMQMLLVGHALKSKGRIAAIEAAASRAKFFAIRADRRVCFADIERAMLEAGTISPDQTSEPPAPAPRPSRHTRAVTPQTPVFPNSRRSRLVSFEPG